MGTWEDELDLDLSDIFGAASKPVSGGTQQQKRAEEQEKDDDHDDDLNFASQAPAQNAIRVSGSESESRITGTEPESRVLGTEPESKILGTEPEARILGLGLGLEALKKFTPVPQSENVNADVADAPTQVASLPLVSRGSGSTVLVSRGSGSTVLVSRGSGSTVPLSTQPLQATDPKQRLPPLPTFQPVIPREAPLLPTPNFAADPKQRLQAPGSRNPNPAGEREKAPVDIRKYFSHRGGSSSGAGDGSSRKKPRIPGPVGDLFWKEPDDDEADVVHDDGNAALGNGDDDFNDRLFRRGAWISALHSLNVEEFNPARYAILKVTASSIGSLRTQQVPHFVAVIKELTPNAFGDAAVVLKDPTGTVAGMMNNKVFSNTDYAKTISPGAAIVLQQVAVFSPSAYYLNITIRNVVQVFPANTDLPQGFAPKQRLDAPSQVEKISSQPRPQPQSQSRPQPQSQPRSQQQTQKQTQLQPQPLQQLQPQAQPQLQEVQPAQPPTQPLPSPPPQPQSQAPPPEGPRAPEGTQMANWDLLSPSPSPPREEPKASEAIAEAAKMAGWGDLTDDMEALLNEDVNDFYA